MAWGRRCELGCTSWPDLAAYKICPQCGYPATRYKNLEPIDRDEAWSLKMHADFELFYAKRCERLGIPVDGPIPEPPRVLAPGRGGCLTGGSRGGEAATPAAS